MSRKAKRQGGRRGGGHNKGYWYRKDRGWYVTEGATAVPLCNEQGEHIKDPATDDEVLKKAHARYLLGLQEKAKRQAMGDKTLVVTVCEAYLDHAKKENRPKSYEIRQRFLFDFCSGLPYRFCQNPKYKPTDKDRIHKGYGKREVSSLIPLDVQKWLDAHTGWKSTSIAVKSLKAAFNYAVKMGVIKENPIAKFKAGKGGVRTTYFTEDQEEALYKNCRKPLAELIKVCIRTGARYGSEVARLTAKHVEETPTSMIWHFRPNESKNHTDRKIIVPDDIAERVRQLVKLHPSGALFRNNKNKPWKVEIVTEAFNRLKKRLAKQGIKLDPDACMYSCRHTFAKRMLGGFWSGKPCTLEVLAGLMGNTIEVCWKHYAKWCPAYDAPLIEAIHGKRESSPSH